MIQQVDAAAFALWLAAAADGRVAPDEVVAACGPGPVTGWPDADGTALSVLSAGLSRLEAGVRVVLALSVPGDPGPLVGGPDLLRLATSAGAAVVIDPLDIALVPDADGSAAWSAHPVDSRAVRADDRGDAERALRRALRWAAEDLEALDVAAGRDRVDPSMLRRRRRALPDGVPADHVGLLDTALGISTVLQAAALDSGGALSASALTARDEALRELRRSARRAVEAAASTPIRPR